MVVGLVALVVSCTGAPKQPRDGHYRPPVRGSLQRLELATGETIQRSATGVMINPPIVTDTAVYTFEQVGEALRAVVRARDRSTGKERWVASLGAPREIRSPTLAGHTLIFQVLSSGPGVILDTSKPNLGIGEAQVVAVDVATGEVRWGFSENDFIAGPLVIEERVILGLANQGILMARDLDSGRPLWEAAVDTITANPFAAAGEVFTATGGGEVLAVDPRSGTVSVKQRLGFNLLIDFGMAKDGVLYVAADDTYTALRSRLFALDAETGETLWTIERAGIDGYDLLLRRRYAYLPVANGVGKPGSLLAIERSTGDIAWEYTSRGGGLGVPAKVGGRVFFPDISAGNGAPPTAELVALDSGTGSVLWRASLGGIPHGWLRPVVTDGHILLTADLSRNGIHRRDALVAFDPKSRRVVWEAPLGGEADVGPVVSGSDVFVAANTR